MLRLRVTIWRNLRHLGVQAHLIENNLSGRVALWKRPSDSGSADVLTFSLPVTSRRWIRLIYHRPPSDLSSWLAGFPRWSFLLWLLSKSPPSDHAFLSTSAVGSSLWDFGLRKSEGMRSVLPWPFRFSESRVSSGLILASGFGNRKGLEVSLVMVFSNPESRFPI